MLKTGQRLVQGALLLLVGASKRSLFGACLAASSAPLLYRGVTGHWPRVLGDRPVRRHEDRPRRRPRRPRARIDPAGSAGRRRLPLLASPRKPAAVHDAPRPGDGDVADGRSHWVAAGPAGLAVEWDAEIINEVENKVLAWRSLPGSDVVTAGSVNFDAVRGGRSTQVSVHLQYAPPAGKAGALVASLFGREPSQTIREDLRHFKQLLEAGEIPRATATA